jgi:hypothetical protein
LLWIEHARLIGTAGLSTIRYDRWAFFKKVR